MSSLTDRLFELRSATLLLVAHASGLVLSSSEAMEIVRQSGTMQSAMERARRSQSFLDRVVGTCARISRSFLTKTGISQGSP